MPDPTPDAPLPHRRPRAGIVGPLFKWELVRLARRGQDARARFILATSLLFVLTVFTFAWFPTGDPWTLFFGTSQTLSLQQSSRFGTSFALTFVLAQLAVMVLLAPAYAAGGIAEEKERRTFPFLLVSDLTSWEIVAGKFLGRLCFLLGVLLAGLPVLALTQFYGGVSIEFLVVSYFLTATTVTMHTAVAAASAAAADTYRGALFRAYGFAALHVFVGFGHPLLSPFAVIPGLFLMLQESPGSEWFWGLAGAYGLVELIVACIAMMLAVRWVRMLRAKPLSSSERYARERRKRRDHRDDRPHRRDDSRRPPADEAPIILDDIPPDADGFTRPLPVATLVRTVPVARPAPPRRSRPRPRPKPFVPEEVRNRPRVDADDPFLWKEWYTRGAKRTADDDSIRGMMIAIGVVVALSVGFFVLIAALAVVASGASRGAVEFAERVLLFCGSGGYFTYLLMVGSSAAASVVRERQRLTLESLLTIPVDRRAILWPKWWVSLTRGWWWGILVAAAIPLGFVASQVAVAAAPTAGCVAAGVLFVAAYGLWLSVRARTATRAVLWLLPAVGGITLAPLLVWSWADDAIVAFAVMATLALLTGSAAWVFWRLAVAAFEREGRT